MPASKDRLRPTAVKCYSAEYLNRFNLYLLAALVKGRFAEPSIDQGSPYRRAIGAADLLAQVSAHTDRQTGERQQLLGQGACL